MDASVVAIAALVVAALAISASIAALAHVVKSVRAEAAARESAATMVGLKREAESALKRATDAVAWWERQHAAEVKLGDMLEKELAERDSNASMSGGERRARNRVLAEARAALAATRPAGGGQPPSG